MPACFLADVAPMYSGRISNVSNNIHDTMPLNFWRVAIVLAEEPPELKNVKIFSKLNSYDKDLLKENDFIFLLSLLIVDDNDNLDYFLYKFNISKQNQKRMKIIDNFYKEKITVKTFIEKNMDKVLYYHGKQAVLDILNLRIVKSKKINKTLIELSQTYRGKKIPSMPISADLLMKKYNLPQGKQLGEKLKTIEQIWVKNDFKISDQQVDNIINN